MDNKKFFLILGILIIFISVIGAYASEYKPEYGDLNFLLDETNESDLTGCCSIVCQLDGNDSIMAFRRDSPSGADIYIENITWHGKDAIKQYKTDGKYFCQVIVTNDGWTVGFGGLDDGVDNEKIENITGEMIANNTIDNATLQKIQDMKNPYGRGHALIKAPDGRYGVAMATTHFTGKLNPGDYISVPNKPSYVRTGDIQMNATDKEKTMHKLEITDAYGLVRRDITTYFFHEVKNDTFKGNVTNITLSNDDGSTFGMGTGGAADNVIFNGTTFKSGDIPIAPNYQRLGSIEFPENDDGGILGAIFNVLYYIVVIVLLIIIICLAIRIINKIRYARKRQRRQRPQSLYRNDRYR
ncbi:MAG: hypothetical protein E7Z73_00840 [Methanobrevibacter millerae]|uniref:Adhesin-like protein n=1 Tax=Methanobrevibacter millerae TaxID=230361 RepID=A0A8T3V962_9EURY|nr:hypothetical protein [Methanobrevibacter millerae]MBE6504277.1 hypothetical protein [Methanobrevibacter millerae]